MSAGRKLGHAPLAASQRGEFQSTLTTSGWLSGIRLLTLLLLLVLSKQVGACGGGAEHPGCWLLALRLIRLLRLLLRLLLLVILTEQVETARCGLRGRLPESRLVSFFFENYQSSLTISFDDRLPPKEPKIEDVP